VISASTVLPQLLILLAALWQPCAKFSKTLSLVAVATKSTKYKTQNQKDKNQNRQKKNKTKNSKKQKRKTKYVATLCRAAAAATIEAGDKCQSKLRSGHAPSSMPPLSIG